MSWMGAAVAVSAAGVGLSAYQTFSDKGDEFNIEDMMAYKQFPDYEESTTARKDWLSKLQEWGKPGANYGATDMNWDDVYKSAENKINQYYWGGVGSTGLAGKLKASAARRNASQSPGLENSLTSLGFQQSQDIGDLFTNLTTQKAGYTEKARTNWLNSLQNLAGLKPAYMSASGSVTGGSTSYSNLDASSDILSGVGGLTSQLAKDKSTKNLLKQLWGGNTAPTSISSNLGLANLGLANNNSPALSLGVI